MKAAKLDLVIEQGARYSKPLRWKDSDGVGIPLTGFSARMHIRKKVDAATTLVELTSPGDLILEENSVKGRIEITIGATVTGGLPTTMAVYDLEIVEDTDPENVTRLVEGKITISKQVTR